MQSSFKEKKDQLIDVSISLLDNMLKGGPILLENYIKNNFNNMPDIYYFYKKCLDFIIIGRSPEQIYLLMKLEKISWISSNNPNEDDLKLIAIIESLIPTIQELDVMKFINIIYCIVSKERFNEILESNTILYNKYFI